MYKENEMEYKYKAFISYRHIEPDMQAAERLQKLLEAYKPPKSLGVKKENWRIFRDVSELQSSSDLSEIIKNAIESSEYLIVICSPQYTESKWCLQELTRFRELHDNKNTNIITLLVNGDPRESFPEELTYAEVTTTNEKGEEVTVKVDVEPLAANIVADNIKDSMKKLNIEYLRIAAPLLGCDFNDLYQREKRREAAKRRRIFGGVSGILSLISIISVASAVTINGKNKQIQKQNDQIKEQNVEIENKNSELLVENAGHLAVESENLYKESSLIPAIKKAVAALPSEGEEKPVLPEAEYALSRELGMFRHTQMVPQLSLKHDCAVEQLSFMGGGKSVVSKDATGVYFWDAETGKLIKKLSAADSEFASTSGSNELTAYFDVNLDKTGTYFHNASSPSSVTYENSPIFNKIYTNYIHSVEEDEQGTGGDVYIANSDKSIWRVDGATGEIKWKSPKPDNAYHCYSFIVGDEYVLRMYNDSNVLPGGKSIMGDNLLLEIIDRETGKLTDTLNLNFDGKSFGVYINFDIKAVRGNVAYIAFDDDTLRAYEIKDHALKLINSVELNYPVAAGINTNYLQFFKDEPVTAACSVMAFDLTTNISRYDKEMKEKKWTASIPVNYQNKGKMFLMPAKTTGYEHDVLAVTTNRTVSFVDYENGKLIKSIPIDGEIIDVSFSQNGLVMFTLDSGEEYAISFKSLITGKESDRSAYRVQTMATKISLCSYSLGKYVTADNYSNTAYIQYPKMNSSYKDIDAGEFMYDRNVLAVSDDGTKAAVISTYYPNGEYNSGSQLTDHLFIYDTANGSCTEVTELNGGRALSAAFVGSDKLIVNAYKGASTEDGIMIINTADGKVTDVKDAPGTMRGSSQLIPAEGGAYYLADTNRNLVFVSSDGSFKSWAQKKENSILLDKEIVDELCAVSGSKAAMLAKLSDDDEEKTALIVHDFSSGQYTKLEFNAERDTSPEIQRIFWQNTNTVGVLFSDRTVGLFDAEKGPRKATVSLNGTSQEPVSVAAVGDDKFAVLCRDSHLYEMNAEGFTGRSCRLDFENDYDNDIYESDSTSAALFEAKSSADSSRVYAVWDKSQAWLLDTSRFTVRYRIDDFAAAPAKADTVFISDDGQNKAGFFPIYTTQQLLSAAKDYLTALSEA